MLKRSARYSNGFTLIELMVTIVLLSILLTIAVVSMSKWIRDSKIRSVADTLQNGLRLAQSDALRRNRQVVFSLTDDKAISTAYKAKDNGSNWAISTVKALADNAPEFIEAGVLTDVAGGVLITGPNSICFSSIGRTVPNPTPGPTSANCGSPPASKSFYRFDLKIQDTDRKLSVLVYLGGQVRLCDPAKKLSTEQPDGCPA